MYQVRSGACFVSLVPNTQQRNNIITAPLELGQYSGETKEASSNTPRNPASDSAHLIAMLHTPWHPRDPDPVIEPGIPLPPLPEDGSAASTPEINALAKKLGRLEEYDRHAEATKARFVKELQACGGGVDTDRSGGAAMQDVQMNAPPAPSMVATTAPQAGSGAKDDRRESVSWRTGDSRDSSRRPSFAESFGSGVQRRTESVEKSFGSAFSPVTPNTDPKSPFEFTSGRKSSGGGLVDASRDPRKRR